MVDKIKAFSQSDMMQVYKAIIGTGIFIILTFVGYQVTEMKRSTSDLSCAVQKLANNYVAMEKDVYYVKRDLDETKKKVETNRASTERNKIDINSLKFREIN